MNPPAVRRAGVAWAALCAALALHVTDEALTDFLSVYNPAVLALRGRVPFLPLPTFTFAVWLTGLILAVLALAALTPFAFRGAWWMRLLSLVFAGLMTLNALGHIGSSLYLGRAMPGLLSAPLLLAASVYLLLSIRRDQA